MDTFGRTRRCLRKDLPVFQQQDAELTNQPKSSTSQSYGNFVRPSEENLTNDQNILGLDDEAKKRQRELWEEEEEKNRQKPNVHYQDVLFQGKKALTITLISFSLIEAYEFKLKNSNLYLYCTKLRIVENETSRRRGRFIVVQFSLNIRTKQKMGNKQN